MGRRISWALPGLLLLSTSMAGVGTAAAGPIYDLSATINVGTLRSFDISYVDPVTGTYYFADRTSASVQIINPTTFSVIGQATGFAGPGSGPSTAGPDGVLVVDNGTTATLYAGDYPSTLRTFDVTNPASPVPGATLSTNGTFRLDEMAYSPSNGGYLLAANNADTPAYASLISTHPNPLAPSLANSPILVPGQDPSGGLEQAVWNPNTGTWFVSVPSFNGTTDAGGVQEFSLSGTPLRTYNFTAMGFGGACGSSGLGLGSNGNLMVGCSNGGPIVLNPAGSGTIVAQLPQSHGADELWYDPVKNIFAVTGVDSEGHRVIDVFDGTTYALLQEIDLTDLGFGTGSAHSVAIDPLTGEILVPIPAGGSRDGCTSGCVAAFDFVPEPPSFPILLAGVLIALGLHLRSRKRSAVS